MHTINNADARMAHTIPLVPDVPFHPGPTYRPPPKPIRSTVPRTQSVENIKPDIYLDFEENSSFQEGVISEDWTNHSFKTQKN